ncbi:hypothetical protein V8C44DRAFT_328812 [Trichoderma aethiopicum]
MHSSEPPGKRSYGFGLRASRAHVARIVCPANRHPNADHPWRGGVTIPYQAYHAEHMRRLHQAVGQSHPSSVLRVGRNRQDCPALPTVSLFSSSSSRSLTPSLISPSVFPPSLPLSPIGR